MVVYMPRQMKDISLSALIIVEDCDVNEDKSVNKDDFMRGLSYNNYGNEYKKDDYKAPQKCTIKNVVFAELDLGLGNPERAP